MSDDAVHDARKRLKKLRALLRLVKPSLGNGTFKTENRRFRDMGRTLSATRDADVMIQTLDDLARELEKAGSEIDVSTLRETLVERREAHRSGAAELSTSPGPQVARELTKVRSRAAGWTLAESGFDAAGPGFQAIYKRGRKALKYVRKRPNDQQFHEWRKRVKDHWYHSRLLRFLWPTLMRTYAHELKVLSDLLGDDHDLAVFRQTLRQQPRTTLAPSDRQSLLALAREKQRALRFSAIKLGLRVYAEKPGRIRKRFECYSRVGQY